MLQKWLKLHVTIISTYPCYQSRGTSSSHLILLDPLSSCTSCLSQWSISCVSITPKRKVYYTVGTIAHNGPLFWLSVVERSLVKHISSTLMSHSASSIHFYLPSLPLLFHTLHSFCSTSDSFPTTLSLFLSFALHAESIFISH